MIDIITLDDLERLAAESSPDVAQEASILLLQLIDQPEFDIVACRRVHHLAGVAIDLGLVATKLIPRTRVPLHILNDEQEKTRNQYVNEVDKVLCFLKEVVSQAPEAMLQKTVETQLIICVATFLGDFGSRWSNEAIKQHSQELLRSSQGERTTRQFVSNHLSTILHHHIKPYFVHHPNIDKSELKIVSKPVDAKEQITTTTFYEEQKWKSEYPECPFIFSWCIQQVKQFDLLPLQHLVVPTILTLLDDFDPQYKTLGVQLTRHVIIENTAPSEIRATGLGDVFFNALITCLSYHSDPDLLEESLSTSLDLSSVIEVKGTEMLFVRYERIADVFARGLLMSIGGKLRIMQIYMEAIPLLFERLGVLGVPYLKQILVPCCEVLSMQYMDAKIRILAARAIFSIINTCWPRMNAYRGCVLSAIVSAWKFADPLNDELKNMLVDLCHALARAAEHDFKADLDFLVRIDQRLFGPLVAASLALYH